MECITRRITTMRQYMNLGGKSGIRHYESGYGCITVQFSNGWVYKYTSVKCGWTRIADMQLLALAGHGLNGYINRYVRDLFSEKWRAFA